MAICPERMKRDALRTANKLRKRHGCPPLEWKKELAAHAQEWADSLCQYDALEHRSQPKYGENIYRSHGTGLEGRMAVQLWYAEKDKYDFKKNEFNPECGHFTQLIWKQTEKMGVGVAVKGDTIVIVSNFHPPGNVRDQFKANVPPAKKKKARKKKKTPRVSFHV